MMHKTNWIRVLLTLPAIAAMSLHAAAQQMPAQRMMQPTDLFRVQRVGATAWSPDGRYVSIEFSRPGRVLGGTLPNNDIHVLDVRTLVLRTLNAKATDYIGFFNAVWSPDGQRLAFLSVDANTVVRAWIWNVGEVEPSPVPDVDVRVGTNDPPMAWISRDRIAVLAWDVGTEKSGSLYARILRGRNVADQWQRAFDGDMPSVSALKSGGPTTARVSARLVAIDLRTGTQTTLARGGIHRLSVSSGGRFISFLRESPGLPGQRVASYLERDGDADVLYDAVQFGTEHHVIDAQSGAEVAPSSLPPQTPRPTAGAAPAIPLPRPDARRLSLAPTGDAALYIAHASDGSRLWLSGGAGRPMASSTEIWQGNQWMREIRPGRAEAISYATADGAALTAWLLLPPDYVAGTRVPMVTMVYPGRTYGVTSPASFSLVDDSFNHPQLFAALGYAVLLPTMPAAEDPRDAHALASLSSGVLPAVDAVIARGIADADRIAVVGQSGGGFATLGLITQTTRFRSAIASAGYSNFISLYGTFYGQYRHGDAGPPQKAQVLRMLMLEKGVIGLGGPPWVEAERYRASSAILRADKVETPLMLVHGELDFIPIQQSEEFFTALYRQDKRAVFLRYQGEEHTIAYRANVLDLWTRIADWLSETMAPRN